MGVTPFAELHCHSNFSFLDAASHPAELAVRAAELGIEALAITDTAGVYGAVRFRDACARVGVKRVFGACLEVDGEELTLLARTRAGWSNLCRLLSLAHRDQPKGEARTTLAEVAGLAAGLYVLTATRDERLLRGLVEALGREHVFVELYDHLRPQDRWNLEAGAELAGRCRVGTVATNRPRYHDRARRPLHDVLTAIRHRATLDEVRHLLAPNSEQVLKGPEEMARLLAEYPEALDTPRLLAQECDVTLDFRDVRFP